MVTKQEEDKKIYGNPNYTKERKASEKVEYAQDRKLFRKVGFSKKRSAKEKALDKFK